MGSVALQNDIDPPCLLTQMFNEKTSNSDTAAYF